MTTGQASASFTIYDLLTRIIPGTVFLIPQVAIATEFNFPFLSDNPAYGGLFLILSSLVIGEIINGVRLSMLDVPNQFKRILYSITDNEQYLRWNERKRINFWVWFSQNVRSIDYSFYTNSLFDYQDKTIVETVNGRFDPSEPITSAYDLYELIISDIAGNESRRTRRLRSVYIFQQNTRLALIASALLAFLTFLTGYADIMHLSDGLIVVSFAIFIFVLVPLYLMSIFLNGIASVDRIYIESLLSDYFAYVSNP